MEKTLNISLTDLTPVKLKLRTLPMPRLTVSTNGIALNKSSVEKFDMSKDKFAVAFVHQGHLLIKCFKDVKDIHPNWRDAAVRLTLNKKAGAIISSKSIMNEAGKHKGLMPFQTMISGEQFIAVELSLPKN